jgi:hypothetical protein
MSAAEPRVRADRPEAGLAGTVLAALVGGRSTRTLTVFLLTLLGTDAVFGTKESKRSVIS